MTTPSPNPTRLIPTPIEWLCLFVGIGLTLRYSWLLDDAFVYFRYVDNFVLLGNGLVYNAGEYVEGYTSPAWMLSLVALRALHLDLWAAVLVLGCATSAASWWCLCKLDRELSDGESLLNLPLLYLSANYAANSYFTSGMSMPLVQVWGVAYALFVLKPDAPWRQVAIGISPFVRQELALPLMIVTVWSWWRRGVTPKLLILSAIVAVGGWEIFRIIYYADLFPNTFYLKSTSLEGPALIRGGIIYVLEVLKAYHVAGLALAAFAGLIYLGRGKPWELTLRLEERAVMLFLAGTLTAYVVSIGGDPRHYRYLAFPFFVGVCATGGIATPVLEQLGAATWRVTAPLGVALLALFFSFYPDQLSHHPFSRTEEHTRIGHINDPSKHRHKPELQHAAWIDHAQVQDMLRDRDSGADYVLAESATDWWCYKAYGHYDRRLVHSLGLTDAFLARTPMRFDRPAHKWGLYPLAVDIVRMYRSGIEPEPGAFRRYVDEGGSPGWIGRNLESLEVIERKVWNKHDVIENLRLALTFPAPIDAPQRPDFRPWQNRSLMKKYVLPELE